MVPFNTFTVWAGTWCHFASRSKVLVITFKALHGTGLGYLSNYHHPIDPCHLVRQEIMLWTPSFNKFQLIGSKKRAFSDIVPVLWSILPTLKVRQIPILLSKRCEDLALPTQVGLTEWHATMRLVSALKALTLPLSYFFLLCSHFGGILDFYTFLFMLLAVNCLESFCEWEGQCLNLANK